MNNPDKYQYLNRLLLPQSEPILMPDSWTDLISELRNTMIEQEVLDLLPMQQEERIFNCIQSWWDGNANKLLILNEVRALIAASTQQETGILDAVATATKRYEIEYTPMNELVLLLIQAGLLEDIGDDLKNNLQQSANYSFWTPLMDPLIFEQITGLSFEVLRSSESNILNAGAGSGEFEKNLLEQGLLPQQLTAVDLSTVSTRRIEDTLGVRAVSGRFDAITQLNEKYDLIFLQYFIDRDNDQRATFMAALSKMQPGSTLVLEGLLPSLPEDSSGIRYIDSENSSGQITEGVSAVGDVTLICTAIKKLAAQMEKNIVIDRICVGVRYVYSQDGFELLPSYFITARCI